MTMAVTHIHTSLLPHTFQELLEALQNEIEALDDCSVVEWLKPYMDDGELTTTDLPPLVMMNLKSEFTLVGWLLTLLGVDVAVWGCGAMGNAWQLRVRSHEPPPLLSARPRPALMHPARPCTCSDAPRTPLPLLRCTLHALAPALMYPARSCPCSDAPRMPLPLL